MKKKCLTCQEEFTTLTAHRRYCIDCSNGKQANVFNKEELRIRANLKKLRIENKMTQRELSSFLCCTEIEISNLENNRGKLGIGLVLMLLDVYNGNNGNKAKKITLNDLYL